MINAAHAKIFGTESLDNTALEAIDNKNDEVASKFSVRSVKVGDSQIGPLGELYDIKLNNPTNPEHSITVPVFVQMQPSIIPAEIAPRFIDRHVSLNLWQRWTQMTVGEISFWKDFVFQADMIKRHMSTIKNPEYAAAFADYLKTVSKKDNYAFHDATNRGGRVSHNLSNSVVVFAEDTVRQVKAESAFDLHRPADRERYFKDTYTMIIAVVDPMHQRVTVYFNGIDGDLDLAYSDFRPNDKKFDPNDFMQALSAFSSGNISRLR